MDVLILIPQSSAPAGEVGKVKIYELISNPGTIYIKRMVDGLEVVTYISEELAV